MRPTLDEGRGVVATTHGDWERRILAEVVDEGLRE
jgi:hypothetical protein